MVHIRGITVYRALLTTQPGLAKSRDRSLCAVHDHRQCSHLWARDRRARHGRGKFVAIVCTTTPDILQRHPTMVHRLGPANLKWDKVELAAFFVQETIISLLYIRETARHLQNVALLGTNTRTTRRVLHHLIFVNVFIICLDCSLIGLCYAGFFFLQGYYKVAVYAVKLRTEFTILNQLRSSLPGSSEQESEFRVYERSGSRHLGGGAGGVSQGVRPGADSQDSDIQMVVMRSGRHGGITIQKDVVISSTRRDNNNDSFEAARPPV